MRVIKKVIKIGGSLGIILDKLIIDNLNNKEGNDLIIDINKDFRKIKNDKK